MDFIKDITLKILIALIAGTLSKLVLDTSMHPLNKALIVMLIALVFLTIFFVKQFNNIADKLTGKSKIIELENLIIRHHVTLKKSQEKLVDIIENLIKKLNNQKDEDIVALEQVLKELEELEEKVKQDISNIERGTEILVSLPERKKGIEDRDKDRVMKRNKKVSNEEQCHH